MATLTDLQNYKTAVDQRVIDAGNARTRVNALVAALDAVVPTKRTPSQVVERRLLAARAGHLAHVAKIWTSYSTFLAAEIARVQLGGTSTVVLPTLPGDVSGTKTVMPVNRGQAL